MSQLFFETVTQSIEFEKKIAKIRLDNYIINIIYLLPFHLQWVRSTFR